MLLQDSIQKRVSSCRIQKVHDSFLKPVGRHEVRLQVWFSPKLRVEALQPPNRRIGILARRAIQDRHESIVCPLNNKGSDIRLSERANLSSCPFDAMSLFVFHNNSL